MPELTDEHRKNLAAWVADLRKGGPQVQGRLCETTADGTVIGHCCLGRLEDLAIREWGFDATVEISGYADDDDLLEEDEYGELIYERWQRTYRSGEHREWAEAFPHQAVKEAIGEVMTVTVDPKDGYGLREIPFFQLNDDHGWSFERIADAIEAEYLKDSP